MIETEMEEVLLGTLGLIFVLKAEIFFQVLLTIFFLPSNSKNEAYFDWYFL